MHDLRFLYALPPIGRVAARLDAHRDARVAPLLSARRGATLAVREALDVLRDHDDPGAAGTVHRHARELLEELREHVQVPTPALRAARRVDQGLRSDGVELLDRHGFPHVLKTPTMLGLHWVNLALGSYPVWAGCVDAALGSRTTARVYDLAAGTGGFARWLARNPPAGRSLTLTTSDRDPGYVAAGARAAARDGASVRFETRDALDLRALRDARSVDMFLCTQAAHHLHPGQLVRMIAQSIEAAPGGILLLDLSRSLATALGTAGLLAAIAPWPVLLYDGVLSARRAYTPAELRLLAALAGADAIEARPLGPAHLLLHARRGSVSQHF